MPRAPPPGFYLLSFVVIFVWFVIYTRDHQRPIGGLSHVNEFNFNKGSGGNLAEKVVGQSSLTEEQHGNAIAGKLGNETLKAEIGQAAWKLFHTTMAQFPDKPSKDESQALKDYIHLFARLYPCGECAIHFQQIIKKFPPQTSSRSTAAAWACFVHNEVNKSKGKELFDCAKIGDWYNCGCADDEKEKQNQAGANSDKIAKGLDPVEIQKEGPTRGG